MVMTFIKNDNRLLIIMIILTMIGLSSCASKEKKPEQLSPEESIARAETLIDEDKYEEARQILNEVRSSDVTRKYAPIAQLKIAESYEKDDNLEAAVNEYRRYIDQYPDSVYSPYAQFQIAMIYFSQIRGPDRGAGQARAALKEFRKLQTLYPRNPYKEVVELNIEKALNTIAEYEFLVGKFYFKKGSYRAALGRFLEVMENYPGYKATDEVMYYITVSYDRLNDTKKRERYEKMFHDKYPKSEHLDRLKEELLEK